MRPPPIPISAIDNGIGIGDAAVAVMAGGAEFVLESVGAAAATDDGESSGNKYSFNT